MASRLTILSDSSPMKKGRSKEKELPMKDEHPAENTACHKEETGHEKGKQDKGQKQRSAERSGKRRLRIYRGGCWERTPVPVSTLDCFMDKDFLN